MARINANQRPEPATPNLLPEGRYLCVFTGVECKEAGAGWKVVLSVLTPSGATTLDVMGSEDRSGKGPWIQRVAAALAWAVAPTVQAPGEVQPVDDFDWEAECDLRAALLGGTCWLPLEIEAGKPRPTGDGTYPARQAARYLNADRVTPDDVRTIRALQAWKDIAPTIKAQRARAIEEWHIGLERAAAGGSAAADNDDDIDF